MKGPEGSLPVAVACALAMVIFVVDLITRPVTAIWLMYLIPVFVASRASYRKAPYFIAGACTGLIVVHLVFNQAITWALIVNAFIWTSLLWISAAALVQRKGVEEELQHLSSVLSATLESTADGILVVGKDGKVVSHNRRFLNMWHIPQSVSETKDDGKLLSFVLGQLREPEMFLSKVNLLYSTLEGNSDDVIEFKDGRLFERHSQPYTIGQETVGRVWSFRDISERSRAEERLRKSEEQFRLISENVEDLIAVLDLEGHRVYSSPSYEHLLGDPKKAFGTDSFQEVHADDRERIKAVFDKIVRTGIGQRTEYRFVSSDGSIRCIESQGNVIRGTDGNVKNIVVVSRDITVQKNVEEELRRAEEKYRSIFQSVPVGLYQSSLEGVYLSANKKMAEILGFESPEALVASMSNLHEEFYVKSGRRDEFVERIRKEGEVYGFESQAYRKDRSIIWVSEDARALYNGEHVLVGFEGTIVDTTLRKRSAESMQRLLRAVEQTHDVVFMTDSLGKITFVNPAFEKVYGFTRDDAYGKNPSILKSGVQDAAFYARFWDTLSSGQNMRVEFINKTKNGRLVVMESTVSPVFDSAVGLSGFIAVQRDVTVQRKSEDERKILEQQLFQAQKLESIGTLASGIAHDFNNVLGIVLGYATVLRSVAADNEKAFKSIEAITNAVQRGADLVRQILMFARKTDLSFMPLDVNQMVRELEKMIGETFPKTIVISTSLDTHGALIEGDRTQIHQTLLNLLVNARDAMPDGGTISISTGKVSLEDVSRHVRDAKGKDFIHMSVSDTGSGMDEATKQKIFEPFFTTKEQGKGTGLGLAVVYGIIKSHNGYIDVQSSPGQGTTFNLYFPVLTSREQINVRPAKTPVSVAGGTETILVIEDEKVLRELMKASLESKGYGVIAAADGAEALKLYSKHHPEISLVILDLGLPKLDGSKVFDALRKINPAVKVLISSGYIDSEAKSSLLEAGVMGFLPKPSVLTDIFRRVRETMDAEQTRQMPDPLPDK